MFYFCKAVHVLQAESCLVCDFASSPCASQPRTWDSLEEEGQNFTT